MKPKKIVLDVQHMGKPHNPSDRGATCNGLVEADFCLEYALIAYRCLASLGHKPFLITHDYYRQRAAFANLIKADLYLACHLNSSERPPTHPYALVEFTEYAGPITRQFAQHLAQIFGQNLPVETSKVHCIRKGERGWSCINRVAAPALLLEPLFINHHASQELLINKTWLISAAIVNAVKTFEWGN